MEEIVYLKGSLMPSSQARLSCRDYGFLYGYGLFETMRAYSAHVFLVDRHLDRLYRSASFLGIDSADLPDMRKAIYDTLQANRLSDARIRLTVSGGEGTPFPDLSLHRPPTVLIVATPYAGHSDEVYHRGFTAIVSRIRRNTQSPSSGVKSLNYLDSLLARQEARMAGADEAVLLNEQGFVAEASTSNVFAASADTLLTPSEGSGILPGITREVVLELAGSLGLRVVTGRMTLTELSQADEAFLTNSLVEIMPLTQLSEQVIGSGRPGTLTVQLSQAYKTLVGDAVNQHSGRTDSPGASHSPRGGDNGSPEFHRSADSG